MAIAAVGAVGAEGQDISLNINDIKKSVKVTEASTTLDSELQSQLVQLYEQAIENLETATKDRAQSRQFVNQLESAPGRITDIRRQLDKPLPTEELSDSNLATLEKRLLNQQTDLLRLRAELADTSTLALAEKEQDVPELLAEALQQRATSQAELSAPFKTENAELIKARRVLRLSKLEFIDARAEMLRKQLISRDARLELLDLRGRLLTRQINATNEFAGKLQSAVNIARQTEAGEIAQRTRQRAEHLDEAPDEVKALASNNLSVATDTAAISNRTKGLLSQLEDLQQEHARLDRYFTSMTQQLAVSGANRLAILGVELRNQRQQLAQRQKLTLNPKTLDVELARAQINQLRLEDRQHSLAPFTQQASPDLKSQLLSEQADLLQSSVKTYQRYIDALSATRSENQVLQVKIEEYRNLLDSQLFWIPSSPPLSLQTLFGLGSELRWLLDVSKWQQVLSVSSQPARLEHGFAGILLVIAVIILGFRVYLKTHLKQQAVNIGKVNRDRFSRTFVALLISLLLAMPGPLILISLAMLIHHGGPFALQISQGLHNAAGLWFLLDGFRQICRRAGLAEVHFQWSPEVLLVIRKNLPWLIWALAPIALLTPIVDNSENQYDVISRLLFAIASLALSYAAHRVLRARSLSRLMSDTSRWYRPVKYLFYPLAFFLPLLLLALSCYGYHFTALEIESKLFTMVCLLAVLLVVYCLGLRAVSVLERRMMLEEIRVKRKAERARLANRQAADDAAEGMPESIKPSEYSMTTIHKQSRVFLTMLLGLAATFLLWNLWADFLPAVSLLNNIELWSITASNPKLPDYSVTLANLALAILLIFLTYFGARNIPGALEISILHSMKLDPGARYAVTTIVKYLIVLLGITFTLSMLGAQWSKLQWLIAALGVGVGFGLQEIVANFISGLLILFERPIRVGDTITVGNNTGTVTRIRSRATVITDWDRKEQIIPNKTFITEQLTNWTLSDAITRQVIKVGVAYGSDVAVVHRLLSAAIAENHRVVSDPPPAVFFVGFGDSSLDFEIRVFVQNMLDIMPLIHELHVDIEARLREHGIEIPFPQRDIWIRSEPQDTPGNGDNK